jgi:hypothetical protein
LLRGLRGGEIFVAGDDLGRDGRRKCCLFGGEELIEFVVGEEMHRVILLLALLKNVGSRSLSLAGLCQRWHHRKANDCERDGSSGLLQRAVGLWRLPKNLEDDLP